MFKRNLKFLFMPLVLAILLKVFVFEIRIIGGSSMEPTLNNNDIVIFEKMTLRLIEPKTDDIVVVNMNGEYLIKRIVAKGNDIIEFKNNVIYINNIKNIDCVINVKNSIIKVPLDYFFILGDNTEMSVDSRTFGPIHRSKIIGKYLLRAIKF